MIRLKASPIYLAIVLLLTLYALRSPVYAALPDLTVSSIWLERSSAPGVPVAGSDLALNGSFVIVANVTNLGQETAYGFYLDVYYDGDYGRGGPDNITQGEVQQWFVGPLTATSGAHTTQWVVDPDNQIAELNEQNNQKQYAFTIGNQTAITTTSTTAGSPNSTTIVTTTSTVTSGYNTTVTATTSNGTTSTVTVPNDSTTLTTSVSTTASTASLTYRLSDQIVGSSGRTASLLLSAQCSKPVGSYQFVIDLPLGNQISSVGSPTATGFMAGGSLLTTGAQLRWFNLAANGGTGGNLTIPILLASGLPSASNLQITLNSTTTIRDVAGVAMLVSPALPLSSNVNVIYPVATTTVYQALDSYFSNSVWSPIGRVPRVGDLYDLLDIYFTG
jgi:hypothetical protein